MSSNLPPGVSVSDIPGNRPEDREFEELQEWIDRWMEQHGITDPEIMRQIILIGTDAWLRFYNDESARLPREFTRFAASLTKRSEADEWASDNPADQLDKLIDEAREIAEVP